MHLSPLSFPPPLTFLSFLSSLCSAFKIAFPLPPESRYKFKVKWKKEEEIKQLYVTRWFTMPNPKTVYNTNSFFVLFCFLFVYVCLFRAACMAYGGSQARGQIRAIAAGLRHSHSNMGPQLHLQPTPQLTGNAGSLTH